MLSSSSPLSIIIVEKNGNLKPLLIKEFNDLELYKKCGFKQSDNFEKRTTWNVKYPSGASGKKYTVSLYAKNTGRANGENKYDFPPPVDTVLYFGSCALVLKVKNQEGKYVYTNLSVELWELIYEKLFGGFEDLSKTAIEDENEVDELAFIPKEFKTKQGYLKDGFVVDDSTDNYSSFTEESSNISSTSFSEEEEEESFFENNSDSELSKEKYDYDDDYNKL